MKIKPITIVFEGIDGAGKTSQIALLERALSSRGSLVTITGVFQTRYGRDLRTWFMDTERMSHATYRTQLFLLGSAMNQVAEEIAAQPASIVLVDRYVYTTMAYHGGGLNLGLNVVREIFRPVLETLTPDLVIILDLPPNLISQRKLISDRIESESLAFHARVCTSYVALAEEIPQAVLVDAQAAEGTVHARILELVLDVCDRSLPTE